MSPEGVNVRHTDRIWIGGEWVRAHSGRMIELVSPDTEEVIGAVAEADEEDMNAAVAAARAAFDVGPWSELRPPERIACLKRMAQHLHGRTGEIARAWTAQMGGLASFAAPMTAGSTQALEQIIAAAETFTFVETRTSPVVKSAIVAHEPVGVVAAIAPWNAPYGIMLNKVAYALAAGCTVIMKPSPETPLGDLHHRRSRRGGGRPRRRRQPGVRPSRREPPPHQQPGRRQGELHRLDRRGQAHCERLRRAHRALHARARRQVRGHRPRRLSDRCGSEAPHGNDHADERPGVRDAEPRDRSAAPPRRAGRRDRARDEAGRDRPFRRSGRPARSAGDEAPARARRDVHRGWPPDGRSRHRRPPARDTSPAGTSSSRRSSPA